MSDQLVAETSIPDNTQHSQQISMPSVGFEPTISACERPQIYALDRAVNGTVKYYRTACKKRKKKHKKTPHPEGLLWCIPVSEGNVIGNTWSKTRPKGLLQCIPVSEGNVKGNTWSYLQRLWGCYSRCPLHQSTQIKAPDIILVCENMEYCAYKVPTI
jgi:hypothetical protein